MRAIPFQPAHVDVIELREHEESLEVRGFMKEFSPATVTLVHDGRIVAIMGYYLLWHGVIEVFVIPSKYLHTCASEYFWHVRRSLNSIVADDPTLHRIQTRSLADEQTDRWMELLGFRFEGRLKEFTATKADYNMWARTVSDGLR